MTNIIFNHPPTAELSGLQTASSSGKFIVLQWIIPPDIDYFATEIWVSTTNNRASATLYAKETSNSFRYPATVGDTRYFWIRPIDVYGYSVNNPFFPVSATAGVVGTLTGVGTENIEPGAATKITRIALGSGLINTATSVNTPISTSYIAPFVFVPEFPTSNMEVVAELFTEATPTSSEFTGAGTMTVSMLIDISELAPAAPSVGSITLTNGSTTVTGSGTALKAIFDAVNTGFGVTIRFKGTRSVFITAAASATSMTISAPWSFPTITYPASDYFWVSDMLIPPIFSNSLPVLKYRKAAATAESAYISGYSSTTTLFSTVAGKYYQIFGDLAYLYNNTNAKCDTITVSNRNIIIREYKR